jgi:HSP20 family protein
MHSEFDPTFHFRSTNFGLSATFWSQPMARFSHWGREASGAFQLLQHELNRLLEEYLEPARFGGEARPPTNLDPTSWSPAVDVYETPEDMIVVVEVPGIDPATIDVAVTGNVLSLRGVKEAGDLPESLLQLRERRFGAFHRQLTLPNEVDFDTAHAEANQGVLLIRLPKRSASKPRTIPIRPS